MYFVTFTSREPATGTEQNKPAKLVGDKMTKTTSEKIFVVTIARPDKVTDTHYVPGKTKADAIAFLKATYQTINFNVWSVIGARVAK